MKQLLTAVGALALGASAAYYFDPVQGRRRRALVSDQLTGASHDVRDYLAATGKRAADHTRGAVASARGALSFERPDDRQLNERVRARLGRLVSYPHAIETNVVDGRVTLRGHLLADEHAALLAAIWSMRGVRGIDNHLSLHESPENVPGMQGKPHRGRRRVGLWGSTAIPALALAGGVGAGLQALRQDGQDHTGTLSLAMGLLAFGLGDGARRFARMHQSKPQHEESFAGEPSRSRSTTSSIGSRPGSSGGTATPSQAWH